MKKSYTINGVTFTTQQELVAHIRAILKRYSNGEMLDMFDNLFVYDLLRLHPEADRKIGSGVEFFFVADNPVYPGPRSRGFRVHRADGSETDFSFWECVRPSSHSQKVIDAFRHVIEPDLRQFKQHVFDSSDDGIVACPDTGQTLTFTSAHVDHKAPLTFDRMIADFLVFEGISANDVRLHASGDNEYQDRLVDLALQERWIAYHRDNAVLEVVSATANLSLRKRSR